MEFIIYFYSTDNYGNPTIYTGTQNLFLNGTNTAGVSNRTTYLGYFTLFKFAINSNLLNVLGAVEDIGIHNVIMFTLVSGGDDCNLNHEALHGLGLCHTHRNYKPIPIFWKGYKYIFPCAIINRPYQLSASSRDSTENVMSYRAVTKSTWRWQWNIINPKISEK